MTSPRDSAIRKAKLRNVPVGHQAWVKALERAMDAMEIDQPTLGALTGVTQQAVSYWLTGHPPPRPEMQFAIEKALELEPGTLSRHLGFVPAPPEE